MKKLSLSLIVLAAAALILSACAASPTPAAATAASVPQGVIAEGRLMPVNTLDVSFSLSGQVAEVLVKDGETVSAGQALARLNGSPEAQAALARAQQEAQAAQLALDNLKAAAEVNLAQAKLNVITAEKALETARTNREEDATDENKAIEVLAEAKLAQAQDTLSRLESGKGVDPDLQAAAEARLASADAALTSAQAAIAALELKSPAAGTLVDASLQAGQRLAAGQPVFTLADFSNWVVETDNLTEADVVKISLGQKVTVTLDALPEKTLEGEVTHINARYEEKRGDITYTVTVTLKQTDPLMRWGMTAAVTFAR
ncbi:MAG TPA: efflux RND transporter periplasmic adaptor subunit [Anaerolineaceae bacterium]|nr:efflux RND transporter periplasmic adaptor subunit [Anaerolineaceae bacterium]HPN51363.1 efflux RND transporter periplasmic adaptor subunit [Anaerolineaceae bacterium]